MIDAFVLSCLALFVLWIAYDMGRVAGRHEVYDAQREARHAAADIITMKVEIDTDNAMAALEQFKQSCEELEQRAKRITEVMK